MKTLLVSLFGGPGCGKSTVATNVFSRLKLVQEFAIEYLPEYHKCLTYSKTADSIDFKTLHHLYQEALNSMAYMVDVVITDMPPELVHFYGGPIVDTSKYIRLNVFVKRVKKFEPRGRWHTETESIHNDLLIRNLVDCHTTVLGNKSGCAKLFKVINVTVDEYRRLDK